MSPEQSDSHVILTIFVKNVREDLVRAEAKANRLTVSFPFPGVEDYRFAMSPHKAVSMPVFVLTRLL